ncbi:MAG: MarR family winged helix-turn-helix transcriptional regulator [Bermanella sp.]
MSSTKPLATGNTQSAALQTVVARITTCQQSLQRQGMNLGSVSKKGNAFWGVLRLINQHGSMTVPQIAQHRKVSRQRIQVMIDEYVNEGYLILTENPSHKRSKLVALTKLGQREFTSLSDIIFSQIEKTAHEFKKEELQTAARVLEKLQNLLDEN